MKLQSIREKHNLSDEALVDIRKYTGEVAIDTCFAMLLTGGYRMVIKTESEKTEVESFNLEKTMLDITMSMHENIPADPNQLDAFKQAEEDFKSEA